VSGLLDAVTFLTRVPIGAKRRHDADVGGAVPWFPVVGAIVGLVVAAAYAGAARFVPALIAATLAVATGVLITGALHEDGFGDVADAFGGGASREDALRILKDPRLGTFGVLAVVVSVLVRVAAIAALTGRVALVVVPAVHALARAAAVGAMAIFEPVESGLGAVYTRSASLRRASIGVVAGAAIASALLRVWVAPAVAIGFVVCIAMGAFAKRKIGGINGDVLGAIEQLAEMALLIGAVALGRRISATFPFP